MSLLGTKHSPRAAYGALTVNGGVILTLSGGLYQFTSWNVGQGAKVYFAAPSEVRIAGMVLISQNGYVGPQPGVTTVDANRIVLYVAGTDGQSGPGNQPRAVAVDQNGTLSAYVVAPNGMINFRQNVIASGAFIGKWLLAEQNSKVTRPVDPTVVLASAMGEAAVATVVITDTLATAPTVVSAPASDMTTALYLPLVAADATLASGAAVTTTVGAETPATLAPTLSMPVTDPVINPVTNSVAVPTDNIVSTVYLPLVKQ